MSIYSVNFYNISDDPRVLYKTTGEAIITPSSVTPYQPVDYVNPKLILGYNESIHNCNYCAIKWKVDTFTRYYYIRDVELANGEKMIVHLDEDVLMTYQEQIKELPCYVLRSSTHSKVTQYIYDERSPHFIQGWNASFYPDGNLGEKYVNLLPDDNDGLILITAG